MYAMVSSILSLKRMSTILPTPPFPLNFYVQSFFFHVLEKF